MDLKIANTVLFIAACVLLYVNVAYGIKCYDCTYVGDGDTRISGSDNCKDPWTWTRTFDKPPTTECFGSCVKAFAKTSGGGQSVIRTCSPICTSFSFGGTVECCSSDECNSAYAMFPSMALLLLVAVIALLKNII